MPIVKVWLAWLASLLGLGVAFTGAFDWELAGRVVAGERFVAVPASIVGALVLLWAGRRTEEEKAAAAFTVVMLLGALAFAPLSFEQFTVPWALHQVPVGLGYIGTIPQLAAWRSAAGGERVGVTILLVGAFNELVVFIGTQSTAWDAACHAGMRFTCETRPWAPAIIPGLELIVLMAWTILLTAAVRGRLGRS